MIGDAVEAGGPGPELARGPATDRWAGRRRPASSTLAAWRRRVPPCRRARAGGSNRLPATSSTGHRAGDAELLPLPGHLGRDDRTRSTTATRRATASTDLLPGAAAASDGQRQQLVRRLAAHDDSMDILGLDVTWEAEFAQAGWIVPWTGANKAAAVERHARAGAADGHLEGAARRGARTTPTPSSCGTGPTW